jgi:hypothetical protein
MAETMTHLAASFVSSATSDYKSRLARTILDQPVLAARNTLGNRLETNI